MNSSVSVFFLDMTDGARRPNKDGMFCARDNVTDYLHDRDFKTCS